MTKVFGASTESFQEVVLDCDLPVLVDFWTENCGPCVSIAPLLEEFAERFEGKVKFVKFYVSIEEVLEQTNEVAQKYDVMGFPTLMIFNKGEVVATSLGGLFEDSLQDFIDSAI